MRSGYDEQKIHAAVYANIERQHPDGWGRYGDGEGAKSPADGHAWRITGAVMAALPSFPEPLPQRVDPPGWSEGEQYVTFAVAELTDALLKARERGDEYVCEPIEAALLAFDAPIPEEVAG